MFLGSFILLLCGKVECEGRALFPVKDFAVGGEPVRDPVNACVVEVPTAVERADFFDYAIAIFVGKDCTMYAARTAYKFARDIIYSW